MLRRVIVYRVVAGVALAALTAASFWMSGKYVRDSAARVSDLRAAGRSASEARSEVAAWRAELEAPEATYERSIRDAAAELGLPTPTVDQLAAVYPHFVELEEGVVLASGRSWSSPHLRITSAIEKVKYQQHGAVVSANHSLARIENISAVPLAYRVALSSADRGRCEVHGSRMHNAVALGPGEAADVVVCAGVGAVRVDAVEVIELSEFGARLVSRVPAAALGADPVTAGAHRPTPETALCEDLDVAAAIELRRSGQVTWADLVDFFARHDCRRFPFPPSYRRATAVIASLPAGPPSRTVSGPTPSGAPAPAGAPVSPAPAAGPGGRQAPP